MDFENNSREKVCHDTDELATQAAGTSTCKVKKYITQHEIANLPSTLKIQMI